MGTYAYRSAKRRALGLVVNTRSRVAGEIAVIACMLLWDLYKFSRVPTLVVQDPIVPVVIPFWIIVAYVMASLRSYGKPSRSPRKVGGIRVPVYLLRGTTLEFKSTGTPFWLQGAPTYFISTIFRTAIRCGGRIM
jgi:hypothetical protein